MAKFGKLIHKYTIKDGVDDGAIVPLITKAVLWNRMWMRLI